MISKIGFICGELEDVGIAEFLRIAPDRLIDFPRFHAERFGDHSVQEDVMSAHVNDVGLGRIVRIERTDGRLW